jgi:very-short-patch-repair endonuclease
MEDEAIREPVEPPAPGISPDFLTGSTELGLDRIRTRLLDLTNRNKLLNFKHSNASSLRVVDASLDDAFQRLRDNEKVAFEPVPEPDYEIDDEAPKAKRHWRPERGRPDAAPMPGLLEQLGDKDGQQQQTSRKGKPTAKDHAETLGWNTSYDLDDDAQEDVVCRVLHFHEQLDTVSRKIATAANTAIEESGTNMLYLVFGFLEWYESDDSKLPRLAPLITLPVSIERSGGKGKSVEVVIEYTGEDLETNLSLAEKMRRDFGLEIPVFDEDDTPGSYFAKFDEILEIKNRWSIRSHMSLALLSFGKLLMYRDLDPKNWPAGESIAKHDLVRELFEGTKNTEVERGEEYAIDAPELKEIVPHLIRDADSSQHSALIHALRGQNLVIEGPPGTGKSQTITNLIAAVLAKGKNVLFVAEKLAALEVVRSRMDDAGLGVFCLEVHSHKTKKGALLNDLAQRCKARGSFRDPQDLDRQLAVVEDKKRLLSRYAALVNTAVEPFNETVFNILWARDRCGQEVASHRERLGQVILPAVVKYSQVQFTQGEQFIAVYAQHLAEILAPGKAVEAHPWAWVEKPLVFEEEERLQAHLDEFMEIVGRAEKLCQHLSDKTGLTLSRTARGLEHASLTLAALPASADAVVETLLEPCQSPRNRRKLGEFIGHVRTFRRGVEDLSASAGDVNAILDGQAQDKLSGALETLGRWGLDAQSVADLRSLAGMSAETARLLGEAHASFRILLTVMGCEASASLATAGFLLETVRIVENAPFERLHLRHASFENENTKRVVENAAAEAKALKESEKSLAEEFDLTLGAGIHTAPELLRCADALDKTSLWGRLFGGDYRKAVKTYRRIVRNGKGAARTHMSGRLRSVADYTQSRSQFENHAAYRNALGPNFQGIESEWEDLQHLVLWYEQTFVLLPEHQSQSETFRSLLFSARTERLKAIKANVGSVQEHREALEQIVGRVTDWTRAVPSQRAVLVAGSFDEIAASLERFGREVRTVLEVIETFRIKDTVTLRELPGIVSRADECRRAMAAVQADTDLPAILGDAYRGVTTDIEPIEQTVQFAASVASGTLPQKGVEWLLSREHEPRLSELRAGLKGAHGCGERLRGALDGLAETSGSEAWREGVENSWGSLRARAEHAVAYREDLSRWNHFLRLRIQSHEQGLDKLTLLGDTRVLGTSELGAAFRFAFYNTLARSIFTEQPELSHVTGVTQEQVRQQFAAADREAIRLYSERVAALIDRRYVPDGERSGPVKDWTELSLIVKEINKQKRHIPIRQLFQRAPRALLALKPCFMMGPLSVAQYLAPGKMKFDLVVMDEASQLKPEDAIGSLARGGKVVIVGDPKQLPPTNFFQRVSMDAEDDDDAENRAVVEEGESILDVASTLFQPVRRLRWHYRSQHHSLIAFSNQQFYQGDLIIFPSAYHKNDGLGLKYHSVPDGVCENSRNPREAAVVVEAVLEHMRRHPAQSLGVVTLNFEQRELIEELLDKRLRDDPDANAFQERMSGGQETLFVKNLENVQGDERDVIFISTTYGPDAQGNQYNRFGPITHANGHRRLNVLFTRSKMRTEVFSSLDPDKIHTAANSPWGIRALKEYLIYARSGFLQQADDGLSQETNDFERAVGAVLMEKGYDVVPQVGVAGFFIDLAVKHPAKGGTYLLGIECDGASYHSGRSARDRDRLRQEILEKLGWKIHRVWSTDWFKSRENEIKRLVGRIESLLQADPAYREMQEKAVRRNSLRQRLTELREEIRSAFPDAPHERCLLRDDVLDEFIQKRPKNRDDWFRKISEQMRTSIDSKQVGRYLNRIFEIVLDCG